MKITVDPLNDLTANAYTESVLKHDISSDVTLSCIGESIQTYRYAFGFSAMVKMFGGDQYLDKLSHTYRNYVTGKTFPIRKGEI